ncbi:DUF1552 domain-containing protein [Pelagicoccus mobilis]|uniref:DUF1552 domain-containing protein n=1 Tax=Pelagicoccus mobilis TaxID=415221 RepID=A0A934RZD6_9BACT|nr:DUF1552 domain-containing protein [Pelagicoccus mobilis]MBK1877666.1 DUF1552 domain-containing protein [Pelagicoccus mobilis]
MNTPYIAHRRSLSRRKFLKGASVALSLPLLDAMSPAFASSIGNAKATFDGKPRRVLAICNNLGLLPDEFFPKDTGSGFTLSPYLELIQNHRNNFTVFSGVSHPDVDGGHPADNCFLTAAPHPGSGGFKNTISLDQHIAEQIGHHTRFPSLTLGVNVAQGVRSLSWTASGVMIPCEEKASDVFRSMFIQGTAEEAEVQIKKLELGQSILDTVSDQANSLKKELGTNDRARLDQYFTSVRDLEKRMAASKEWERKPKPSVSASVPLDPEDPKEYMDKTQLMYEISRLAFQTDSTRVISLMLDSVSSPAINIEGEPVSDGYHNLSHHGKSEDKLEQLRKIDSWHMNLLSELFDGLQETQEDGDTLLDRTMILYGSNLGNAHAHTTTNLPILFAGGGFKHGHHLAFDTERNSPLPNLFVSMLQRLGIESDKFASSTGTMRGLELA